MRYFISISEMKQLGRPVYSLTVPEIRERIAKLKQDHEAKLEKLYEYYAKDVDREALERYHQTELYKYFDDLPNDDEWREHYRRLDVSTRLSLATLGRTN